jgi:medium-chain acyl-[acyl-carrier-protein] hydrolase
MGGVVALELARRLERDGRAAPVQLFVSAAAAPHVARRARLVHLLSDAELLEQLRRVNGTPQAVLASTELMALMLPVVRADFTAFETHRFRSEPPLGCPITAFGGLGDRMVDPQHLARWRDLTTAAFALHMLPGDHFFLNASRRTLLRLVALAVAGAASDPPVDLVGGSPPCGSS